MKRHPPLSPHSTERGKSAARAQPERSKWNSALALGALGPFGQLHRPAYDAVLEILVGDLVLAGPDLAAHRHAGRMHRVGVARDQRMPPIEIMPIGHQAIAAGRRQPDYSIDVARG